MSQQTAQPAPATIASPALGPIDQQQWRKNVPLVRVPLAVVAAAMLAGTIIGRYAALPAAFWLCTCAAGLLLSAFTLRRNKVAPLAVAGIALAVLAIAALHINCLWRSVDDNHVITYTPDTPIMATVRGQIVTSPHIDSEHREFNYTRPPVTTLILAATDILTTPEDASGVTSIHAAHINEPEA